MTEIEIPWRAPLDWEHLSAFLGRRAIPGMESFDGSGYSRQGIHVRRDGRRHKFLAAIPHPREAADFGARVARLFNTNADSPVIAAHLHRDAMLRPLVEKHPGIRVPGGWDAFEIVIRAIVGQQVSVAAARSLIGAIVRQCGERTTSGLSFPTPDRLTSLRIGMPRRRLDSIKAISMAVATGTFVLERRGTLDETLAALQSLPGIGPWSANYIAMRAFGEADAFPAGDLVLRRNAGGMSEQELTRRAERWRPYRAYAAMLLWTK